MNKYEMKWSEKWGVQYMKHIKIIQSVLNSELRLFESKLIK